MRPGPKKPGESAAEYSARVKAMEQKWMSGGRPKTSSGSSSGGGRGRGGATPPPGMMYGPNDALIPIPKKGGGTPVRVTGGMGMKSGGMVKGKKK
jgi:hypothetical protein